MQCEGSCPMMHAFTGNQPAVAKKIAAAPNETLPAPVASAGRAGIVRPVPVSGSSCAAGPVHTLPGGRPDARVTEKSRIFRGTKSCTSCGVCESVCPVKNIAMIGKRPAWKDHCELCFACIRACPVQAIRVCHRKAGRQQYRENRLH